MKRLIRETWVHIITVAVALFMIPFYKQVGQMPAENAMILVSSISALFGILAYYRSYQTQRSIN